MNDTELMDGVPNAFSQGHHLLSDALASLLAPSAALLSVAAIRNVFAVSKH